MKFSNIYMLYPDSRALEQAISESRDLLTPEQSAAVLPDRRVTVADNFLHTRGNFEQQRFSSKVFEDLRDVLELSLTDELHEKDPMAWADGQNRLGNIYAALGQQQHNTEWYENAIGCFNKALNQLSRETSPLEWAAAQFNLGAASQALGRLAGDKKSLKEAVDAYTNTLLVWTRNETPEEWTLAMHNLGAAFHEQGKLLKGNRVFQKSVVAYKNALAVLDADNYALELTATHNNRGAVLHHLAESEENAGRLEEAIRAYEKAWTVSMEQQLPIHIAVICRVNKATAKTVLAELTHDAGLAEEMADEFEVIMECFPHALQPLCKKHCEAQMEKAKSLALATSA